MGVNTIQPSNPTGLGVSPETLKEIAEICAENNVFFNIDAFYSVIARNGVDILGLKELQKLPPEVLGKISVLVGETKATDSQKRLRVCFGFAPQGHDEMAKSYMAAAKKVKGNWNAYARRMKLLLQRHCGHFHKVFMLLWGHDIKQLIMLEI